MERFQNSLKIVHDNKLVMLVVSISSLTGWSLILPHQYLLHNSSSKEEYSPLMSLRFLYILNHEEITGKGNFAV
jgi:hypothetical protein